MVRAPQSGATGSSVRTVCAHPFDAAARAAAAAGWHTFRLAAFLTCASRAVRAGAPVIYAATSHDAAAMILQPCSIGSAAM
eukprot:1137034-Pelagomonas_calceolata.AAC.4